MKNNLSTVTKYRGRIKWLPVRLAIILAVGLLFGSATWQLAFSNPVITATKTDTLVVDNDNDGQADPGDTISYTVRIENTGNMVAEDSQFSDTLDSNTTLVQVNTNLGPNDFISSPIARNDSYTSLGNVGITVPNGISDLLANDNDPDGGVVSLVAATGSSVNGGDFQVFANGSFTYIPPPGFEGVDTFTYTITDDEGMTDPATVTITVNEVIWFIDNSATCGTCDGRLGTPFNGLTGATGFTSAADEAGDIIFIHETGSGNYTGGISLQNNQLLIGQGTTASIAALASLTIPPFSNALPGTNGNRPTIINPSSDGISLASGNLVRGLNVGNTNGVGISDNGGTVGSLTISEVSITGTGGGFEADNGGTLNVSLDELSASSTGSNEGIHIAATGSFNITSGTISSGNNSAVIIDGNPSITLGVTLTSVSSTGGGNSGIDLDDTTGTFTVTGDGGNSANGSGGTISNKSVEAVTLNNVTGVSLNRMNITGSSNTNGVLGNNVTDFVLNFSNLSGHGNGVDEGALRFINLLGTSSIANSTLTSSTGGEHVVEIINTSGTLTNLAVQNSTFQDTKNSGLGADGFLIETRNSAQAKVTLTNSTFEDNFTQGFQGQAIDSSTLTVIATGNTINNNNEGLVINTAGGGDLNFDIDDNTITNHPGTSLFVGTTTTASNASFLNGFVRNNNIDDPTFPVDNTGVGPKVNHVVQIFPSGNSDSDIEVFNNTVVNKGIFSGIIVTSDNTGAAPTADVRVLNNNITSLSTFAATVLLVQGRQNEVLCAKIEGNNITNSGTLEDIRLRERDSSTVTLEQGSSASGAPLTVLDDNNNPTGAADISVTGAPAVVANGSCDSPAAVAQVEPDTLWATAETSPTSLVALTTLVEPVAANSEQAISNLQSSVSSLQSPISNLRSHAGLASPLRAGETITLSSLQLGDLDPGQVVIIEFQAQLNDPQVPDTNNQVCNQGTVSGTGFSNVLTDDPDVGGSADETCTAVEPPTGSITVVKEVVEGSTTSEFDFEFEPPLAATVGFTLTDSLTRTFSDLAPGDYNVIETFPIGESDDWQALAAEDIVCASAGDSTFQFLPFAGEADTFGTKVTLAAGDDVTCTFKNTLKPGSLTIKKEATPEDGTDFAFTSDIPGGSSFTLDDEASQTDTVSQTITFDNLVTGTYEITETLPVNWQLDNATCTGASGSVSLNGETLSVAVGAGETIECTFENSLLLPDLQLSKDDGGITAIPGGTLVYTLTYTNAGGATANGVVVTDTVPANTTFNAGASSAGWSCLPDNAAGSTCTNNEGNIISGGGGNFLFGVTVDSPVAAGITSIANTATIGDDGSNGPDPTPGNNTASETTPLNLPDLDGRKEITSGTPVTPGDTISYRVVISNTGDLPASSVVFSDTIETNLSVVIGTVQTTQGNVTIGNSPGDIHVEVDMGTLGVGASNAVTITFDVTVNNPVPAGVVEVCNNGAMFGSNFNPTPTNEVCTLVIAAPEMAVLGNGFIIPDDDTDPGLNDHTDFGNVDINGGTLVRTFTISNSGNTALNLTGSPRVTVIGSHAADFSVIVQPNTPVAGAGGTTTFQVEFDPSAIGLRTAELSIDNDDPNENPYNFAIEGTGFEITFGSLTIIKAASPEDGTDFPFTSDIPAGTNFTLDVDSDNTLQDRITFNDLPADSYSITETLPSGWQLASASCTGGSDPGSLTDDTLSVALGAGETVECTFTNSQLPSDLQLSKDDGGLTAVPGGTISYTLTYTNVGGATANSVVITETVPANTTFNATASTPGWSCIPNNQAGSSCTLAIGTVAGNSSDLATFAVNVELPLLAGVTQINNTAQIGGDSSNPPDPTPANNTASDTTPLDAAPDIQIDKDDRGSCR